MKLAHSTFDLLNQLMDLLQQIDAKEYSKPVKCLDGNTVGKHVRHIIEFYFELFNGYQTGEIDYDNRKRSLKLETDKNEVINHINQIHNKIFEISENKSLILKVTLQDDIEKEIISTTYFRELAYNMEHIIHHFAIIKIAIENEFDNISLNQNFGVAYSTINYQKTICAP
ncbi:MAG: DinB family protein [Bacteroidota bacterium]|nr:DinB family protein [Bacteroidota bacterium]